MGQCDDVVDLVNYPSEEFGASMARRALRGVADY